MEAEIWVVVELDGYDDCGLDVFGGIMGPYTKDEAIARAEELNGRELYAVSFRAIPIERRKHHTDDWI